MALTSLLGVLLGLSLWTFHAARGGSYLQDDPDACASCHVMVGAYDRWALSTHRARATCNDCHLPPAGWAGRTLAKIEDGIRHAWVFSFGSGAKALRIHPAGVLTVEANCVRCHAEQVSQVTHGAGPAREAPLHCVRCHAHVGHA